MECGIILEVRKYAGSFGESFLDRYIFWLGMQIIETVDIRSAELISGWRISDGTVCD